LALTLLAKLFHARVELFWMTPAWLVMLWKTERVRRIFSSQEIVLRQGFLLGVELSHCLAITKEVQTVRSLFIVVVVKLWELRRTESDPS
jgi:hypothetical protein